jgi:hypothetical protein
MIFRLILAATALWHAAATWHFLLFPERTLRRTTLERPVNALAAEALRFLGGLNAGIAVIAGLLAFVEPSPRLAICFAGFAVANFSQFAIDLRVRRRGLARGAMFRAIIFGDGVVFLLNAVGAVGVLGL